MNREEAWAYLAKRFGDEANYSFDESRAAWCLERSEIKS